MPFGSFCLDVIVALALAIADPSIGAVAVTPEIDPCGGAFVRVTFANPGQNPMTLRTDCFQIESLGNPLAATVRVTTPAGESVEVQPVEPQFVCDESEQSHSIDVQPGGSWTTTVLVSVRRAEDISLRFVFADRGQYQVTVLLHLDGRVVESNPVQISVRALEDPGQLAVLESVKQLDSPAVLFYPGALRRATDIPILEGVAAATGTEHVTWARLFFARHHVGGSQVSTQPVAERQRRLGLARTYVNMLEPSRGTAGWGDRIAAVTAEVERIEAALP